MLLLLLLLLAAVDGMSLYLPNKNLYMHPKHEWWREKKTHNKNVQHQMVRIAQSFMGGERDTNTHKKEELYIFSLYRKYALFLTQIRNFISFGNWTIQHTKSNYCSRFRLYMLQSRQISILMSVFFCVVAVVVVVFDSFFSRVYVCISVFFFCFNLYV